MPINTGMKLFELFRQPYEWIERKFGKTGAFYSFTTGYAPVCKNIGKNEKIGWCALYERFPLWKFHVQAF